jgi:hypothetical protein
MNPLVLLLIPYVASALDGLIKWYHHHFLPFPQVSWLLNQPWKYTRKFYLLILVIIMIEHGYFMDNDNNSPIGTPMKSSNRSFKLSIQEQEKAIIAGRLKLCIDVRWAEV